MYGAPIHFKPNNASEVFNTLKVEYDDAHGLVKISLPCVGGNETVELPDGAQLAFTYRNNGAGVTDCVKVSVTIGGVTTDYNLGSATKLADILGTGRLTYVPDTGSQSDADVPITFSGEETETATGEKGAFKASVVVKVDAAADQPVITAATQIANSSTQYQALAPGKGFTITLNANFGSDIEDGSESHYFSSARSTCLLSRIRFPPASPGSFRIRRRRKYAPALLRKIPDRMALTMPVVMTGMCWRSIITGCDSMAFRQPAT